MSPEMPGGNRKGLSLPSFPLSMAGGIRAAMQRYPSRIALQDSNSSRSFHQLVERIDRITQAFIHDLALSMNDHAAILADSSIEYLEIVVGASQSGVALATINPRLSSKEVVEICDDAQVRVLFVDAGKH